MNKKPAEIPIPDWLPDWTDESQYPSHANMTIWAWEFLRRNIEYQKDWQKVAANRGMYCFNNDPDDIRKDGAEREGDISWGPIESMVAEKWGYSRHPMDPAQQSDPSLLCFQSITRFQGEVSYFEDCHGNTYPHQWSPKSWKDVALVFNLEQPLAPQLRKAKYQLKGKQDRLERKGLIKPVKANPSALNYPNYLRCFDARLFGAPYSEILSVLFPDESPDQENVYKVKKYYKAASKLVKGGYRNIQLFNFPGGADFF